MYMLTYVMLITVTCSEIAVVVKMKSKYLILALDTNPFSQPKFFIDGDERNNTHKRNSKFKKGVGNRIQNKSRQYEINISKIVLVVN